MGRGDRGIATDLTGEPLNGEADIEPEATLLLLWRGTCATRGISAVAVGEVIMDRCAEAVAD